MFVGHALLAFALVASVARTAGWSRERAFRAGALAGLFAAVPDVDILYGPIGLLGGVSGLDEAARAFWTTGNVIHRGPTHSLLVGTVAAVVFAAWRTGSSRWRALAVLSGSLLLLVVQLATGLLGTLVTAALLACGLGVVALARRWGFGTRTVLFAALGGLLTHPFGDLFTGTPPALLYPLDVVLVSERVALHPDPTLALLGAFALELVVVWLALSVALSLNGASVREHVDRRAALGVAYAGAALAIPAPTMDASSGFVFSVLALGALGVPRWRVARADLPRAACTGTAAVTCALAAYALAYLAF